MRLNNNGESVDSEINQSFLNRLRSLIGRDCAHLGQRCRIIDVLSDEGILVLESREGLPPIQTDQYGQANYRSNQLFQVPIFGNDKASFSDEIMDLFTSLRER